MNKQFYEAHGNSFSRTRNCPWTGWQKVLDCLSQRLLNGAGTEERPLGAARNKPQAKVLDVGCGNLRFESFIYSEMPQMHWEFHCVDNCPGLLPDSLGLESLKFYEADIVQALVDDRLPQAFKANGFHMTACFGVFHHVPTAQLRAKLLEALIDATQPGGLIAIAFWRFAYNNAMAAKAAHSTAVGQAEYVFPLEENDYLLGWQEDYSKFRYCHSFTDLEVEALAASVASRAELLDSFTADGRSEDLNRYIVLKKL